MAVEEKDLSLGIDTSNYKTSVAVVDQEGKILFNHQQLLHVKKGQRGLRQSRLCFSIRKICRVSLRNCFPMKK